MDQSSKEQEFIPPAEEEKPWVWEVIEDPIERMNLIDATIEEVIRQGATRAVGYAELAESDLPQFARSRQRHAGDAREAASQVAQQLQVLQWVIRLGPTQPLPIDRKTYVSHQKAIIALDQVPNPDIQPTPPPK